MEGNFKVFRTGEQLAERIGELAKEISRDYKEVVVACVLKGSFVFCADLVRAMSAQGMDKVKIEFLKVKSYSGRQSTGNVKIEYLSGDVKGRDVLVVEDIVDTGRTMKALKGFLMDSGAKSARVCTLLDKPSRRVNDQSPQYVGFEVPDRFVVGFGLDCDEKYRELDCIGFLE